jgi:D-alanyl-lipoteichoic acid acyltransferase DltB (MBOAT superfamily)
MLFNSNAFLVFLPVVLILYWGLQRMQPAKRALRAQNVLILLASYFFYGWWDWRFLFLIAFSTVVDHFVGLRIHRANQTELPANTGPEARSPLAKRWLMVSLAINLGLLGYFKYANFFIESWVDAWATIGVNLNISTLKIILPVGISFYTFQTISYSIDIYRRTLKPTRDIIAFGAFVSFFPQLVAGPVERAAKLLPQIEQRRTFDSKLATSGLRLMLIGLFKKVVVADTCAPIVDDIFANAGEMGGLQLLYGVALFAVQIYGDFAGYSDIAIGTARLFGIRLMTNFKSPFFSQDMAEFRRRWHISLYTWFRDYLYIPLGGSNVPMRRRLVNVLIIFLVSGIWHGADWSFVTWGLLNALLVLPLILRPPKRPKRRPEDQSIIPSPREFLNMVKTFALFCFPLVYFRAHDISAGTAYIMRIFTHWNWDFGLDRKPLVWCSLLFALDWLVTTSRGKLLSPGFQWPRWTAYTCLVWWIFSRFDNPATFIYFQF